MATLLQKKLAENIIKAAKGKNKVLKRDLLVSAGYDETTAKSTPARIIEQKGVQKELKRLGFDPDSAKEVVKEIMLDSREEGSTRIAAAREVFKVFGTYAAEKSLNMNVQASAEDVAKAIQESIAKFRQ